MDKPKDPLAMALGSRGGSKNTKQQQEARSRNAAIATAARVEAAKRKAKPDDASPPSC